MFKSIFCYYNNVTDTPFLQSKVNMYFFINMRIFKIKLGNYISLAISSLNSLKYKNIKIFYNIFCFEYFYYRFLIFSLIPILSILFLV
jgi:hypothetical protein